jgi:hypothetical protein
MEVSYGSFGRKDGGMTDTPDLVTLLYRADWTRLSLAAEMSSVVDHDLAALRSETGVPGAESPPGAHGPHPGSGWRGAVASAAGPG